VQSNLTADRLNSVGVLETELEQRGERFAFGAPVTAAVAIGESVTVGFGDGMVRFFRPNSVPLEVAAHEGVVLCITADGDSVLSGGDDGRFLRISLDGTVEELANFGTRWVDCVAASHGHFACSSGREAHVWVSGQTKVTVFEHASTVGGLAFDPKGKRLAAAHYGGATIWNRGDRRWKSVKLLWKGFHGDTCFSPCGKYLVTAMQENALHAWRLRGKGDFAMPGYPSKIKSLDWVGDTPYLITSGADEAIAWPFDGKDGPMGRKTVCVAYNNDQLVTCVHALSEEGAVFAGFRDGSVQLAELDEAKTALAISGPTGAEVTAIALSTTSSHLLIGDASGNVLWAPLWAGAVNA
jgi:WD40 repeat protein